MKLSSAPLLAALAVVIVSGWLAYAPISAPDSLRRATTQAQVTPPSLPQAPAPVQPTVAAAPLIRRPAAATLGQDAPLTLARLPESQLKAILIGLTPAAQAQALNQLTRLQVPVSDLASLLADSTGQLYYACHLTPPIDGGPNPTLFAQAADGRLVGPQIKAVSAAGDFAVSVPNSSPPLRQSRPGSANVIYLDFNGHTVTGTAWNTTAGAPAAYVCIPYDTDGNASSFSPEEQAAIVNIWARIAEDYRSFDVNVTTEAPAVFNNRTARVLFTRKTDANGIPNPSSATASGVAYVGVFGSGSFAATYSVSFVYHDGYTDGFVAAVASHEVGHNLGLSHDGTLKADGTKDAEYYSGHGTGATSWSPIMGSGSGQIIQWSRGEYFRANNPQDDLAIITSALSGRADDHANSSLTSTPLLANGPAVQHRGIITSAADQDWFSLQTTGAISLTIAPHTAPFSLNLSALDVRAELYSSSGVLLATSDPAHSSAATFDLSPGPGTYYLRVVGAAIGTPLADPPSGYTNYASIGEYTIAGTVTPLATPALPAIVIHPDSQSIFPGNPAAFSVVATGNPATSYQWQRSLDSGGSWQNLADSTSHTGTTSATLTVTTVDAAMNAQRFRCVVTNPSGNATSSAATLTVQTPPPPVLPAFDGPPEPSFGRGLPAGTSQNLNIGLLAGTDPITYQWRLNGTDIPGANGLYYFVRNWQAADAGTYTVVATNALGSVESAPYTQYLQPEGGWTWRNPRPTGNGTTRAAFLNGQFFVGGLRGTLLVSPDGLNWTNRTVPASNNLYGFQQLNGLYVVLGSLGAVFSSPDAVIWTPRNTGTLHQDSSSGLQFVATNGSRLMAVGIGGIFTTTTDGITWTSGTVGTGDDLNGVAFAFGKFHAVSNTNGRIYSTTDGSTWASVASSAGSLRCITFGAGRLVAGGIGGTLTTSTDGLTWTPVSSGVSAFIIGLDYVNGRFFATGTGGTILTSTDGLQWTATNTNGNTSSIQNVAYGNGLYLAPAQSGTTGRAILTSTDGFNWTQRITGAGAFGANLRSVAANTSAIVTVGFNATSSVSSFLRSTDGNSWNLSASFSGQLNDIDFGNTLFLAVNNSGTAYTSANDGATWSQYALASGENLNGVRYANGLWIVTGASGNSGRLRTSPTGLSGSWTSRISSGNVLNKSIYGDSAFVAVGNSGTIWRSTTGASWSAAFSGTTANLNDVAYGSGLFVAVGAGVVLTSPDGLTWTNRSFTPDTLTSVIYSGSHFIATTALSASGNGSTYYVSSDGIQWTGRFTGAFDLLNDLVAFNNQVYGVGDNSIILSAGAPVLSTSGSVVASSGASTTLAATAAASPVPVAYQWHRNGVPVPGATQLRLAFSPVHAADSGNYTLVATNAFGSTTSSPTVLSVTPVAQTIDFPTLPDLPFARTPLTLAASATSGLPVNFTSVSGPATLSGNALTLTGTGLVTVRATQPGNADFTAAPPVERTFAVLPNFAAWQNARFSAAQLAQPATIAPNAVLTADGLANLLKYALGLDPQIAATSGLPVIGSEDDAWTFTYTRPESVTDVIYSVEVSEDLTFWTSAGVEHALLSTGGGTQTWRARYTPAGTGRLFFRLKVSL
ncbi:MAG: immunoglobulin domain-containing protein [Candidatus Didemnitutus sp.]|nr:immunoglobulin domain-containing protein [Candidatus Didemnitutus sp.]